MITTMHISCTDPKAVLPAVEKLRGTEEFVYVAKSKIFGVDILALYHTKRGEGADAAYNMAKSIVKGKGKIDGIYDVQCYPNFVNKMSSAESVRFHDSALRYLNSHQKSFDRGTALDRHKRYSAATKCK